MTVNASTQWENSTPKVVCPRCWQVLQSRISAREAWEGFPSHKHSGQTCLVPAKEQSDPVFVAVHSMRIFVRAIRETSTPDEFFSVKVDAESRRELTPTSLTMGWEASEPSWRAELASVPSSHDPHPFLRTRANLDVLAGWLEGVADMMDRAVRPEDAFILVTKDSVHCILTLDGKNFSLDHLGTVRYAKNRTPTLGGKAGVPERSHG